MQHGGPLYTQRIVARYGLPEVAPTAAWLLSDRASSRPDRVRLNLIPSNAGRGIRAQNEYDLALGVKSEAGKTDVSIDLRQVPGQVRSHARFSDALMARPLRVMTSLGTSVMA
jgi:hypothetical protein